MIVGTPDRRAGRGHGLDRPGADPVAARDRAAWARTIRSARSDSWSGSAMILGAAIVDMTLIGVEAVRRMQRAAGPAGTRARRGGSAPDGSLAWVVFWGVALTVVATIVLEQPLRLRPVRAGAGVPVRVRQRDLERHHRLESDLQRVRDRGAADVGAGAALRRSSRIMVASILLVSCSVGVDMQQDRSTGWRLGSDRTDPVSLSGHRHRDGRGAVRAVREAVHECLSGAAASTRSPTPRPRPAPGSRR